MLHPRGTVLSVEPSPRALPYRPQCTLKLTLLAARAPLPGTKVLTLPPSTHHSASLARSSSVRSSVDSCRAAYTQHAESPLQSDAVFRAACKPASYCLCAATRTNRLFKGFGRLLTAPTLHCLPPVITHRRWAVQRDFGF